MPRPYVEVHQRVLNPVVTVNDPQQRVCLVGLCTEVVTGREISTKIDILSSVGAGDQTHILDNTEDIQFDIDVANGVLINSDIPVGDADTIDGDLTLTLSDVFVSQKSVSVVNRGETNGNTVSLGYLLLDEPITNQDLLLPDLTVVVNPAANYTSKLVVDVGPAGLNFSTGLYNGAPAAITALKDLAGNSQVSLKLNGTTHSGYIILKKSDTHLLLGSTTVAAHAKLLDEEVLSGAVGITLMIAGTDVPVFTFKLEHAGLLKSKVTSRSTVSSLFTAESLPIHLVSYTDCTASIINSVADLAISELDGSNPLVVESQPDGDVTVTIPEQRLVSGGKAIISATISCDYVVAVTGLSQVTQVDSGNYIDILGVPSSKNPLALAAHVALLNAGDTSISVLGLNLLPRDSSESMKPIQDAFLESIGTLERMRDVYALVPLTTDTTIITAFANHCESMSQPRRGKFRVCLGSSKGAPDYDNIVGSFEALQSGGHVNRVDDLGRLSDETVSFLATSTQVMVGDEVYAVSVGDSYSGVVTDVTAAYVEVDWLTQAPGPVGTVSYTIRRSLSSLSKKARQIELLGSTARSIYNKRLFLTFPGKCSVSYGNTVFRTMDSFYVTAAFSGLLARLEIHRPKNFIGFSGIALQGTDRFTDDELDQISDSGYLVFQQDDGALPQCIHQVNTYHGFAAGTQEFTELSVIANYDYVSLYFKRIVDPFAGTVNIVPEVLATIRASLQAGITNLTANRIVGIGAPLISGSVATVRQSSADSGAVEASVSVRLPKVLNKLILEVVSA